jgi:hypothetical protein
VAEWFLNHKKSVGDWLLNVFKVSCFQTKLVSTQENLPNKQFKQIRNAWYFGFESV